MVRMMMALACTMVFTQYADAAAVMAIKKRDAREVAAVRNQDPNLPGTIAWQKEQVERKSSCNLARHQGARDENSVQSRSSEPSAAHSTNGRGYVR
jgi:hypothetical protein